MTAVILQQNQQRTGLKENPSFYSLAQDTLLSPFEQLETIKVAYNKIKFSSQNWHCRLKIKLNALDKSDTVFVSVLKAHLVSNVELAPL